MIGLFRKYIIGGDTGTREGAWFAFLVVFGLLGLAIWMETQGRDMSALYSLLTVLCPTVVGAVVGAHGHHKHLCATSPRERLQDGLD